MSVPWPFLQVVIEGDASNECSVFECNISCDEHRDTATYVQIANLNAMVIRWTVLEYLVHLNVWRPVVDGFLVQQEFRGMVWAVSSLLCLCGKRENNNNDT